MIRHVVLWSMAAERADELDSLIGELRQLSSTIDEIVGLSVGPPLNDSDFDAVLCVDVANQSALEAYRSHPAHRPSLARLRDVADRIVVADYLIDRGMPLAVIR